MELIQSVDIYDRQNGQYVKCTLHPTATVQADMLNDFSHWISKKKKRKYSKPLKKWCRRILANRRKNKQRKTPNKSTSIKIIKIPYSPLHSITSTGVGSWLIFISRVELLLRSPWFSVNFSIFGLILSSSSFALTLLSTPPVFFLVYLVWYSHIHGIHAETGKMHLLYQRIFCAMLIVVLMVLCVKTNCMAFMGEKEISHTTIRN